MGRYFRALTFFVNVNFAQITAKDNLYHKFDYDVCQSMYEKNDDDGNPLIYNFMYKY